MCRKSVSNIGVIAFSISNNFPHFKLSLSKTVCRPTKFERNRFRATISMALHKYIYL